MEYSDIKGEDVEDQAMAVLCKDVLIVDDEIEIRSLLSEIFRLKGHKVRTAVDGFTALDAMREALPDVLVSDLNMPGMSGFELLSVVRRRLPTVFVVATSGAYEGDAVPEGIAADAFHPKAGQLARLVELIEAEAQGAAPGTPRTNAKAPIWIALSDTIAGTSCAMISCPECLHAMPQVVAAAVRGVHETDCTYCQTPVQYAIVQRLDPRTSQPYAM